MAGRLLPLCPVVGGFVSVSLDWPPCPAMETIPGKVSGAFHSKCLRAMEYFHDSAFRVVVGLTRGNLRVALHGQMPG